MTLLDHLVNLTLAVVLIVGAYQFYFWCQRRTAHRARWFTSRVDDQIQLRAGWVWIYSGIYYPAIGVVVTSVRDLRQFNYMAFSYFVLLALHAFVFLIYPVEVPPHWREWQTTGSASHRFLSFVQMFDARSNCFPSMHVSVATLTALHTARNIPSWGPALPVVFVLLIATSCVFTKQHYLIDLPGGALLGWLCFRIFLLLL